MEERAAAQPEGFGFAVFCPSRGRPVVTGMWKSGKPDPFPGLFAADMLFTAKQVQNLPKSEE